MKKQEFITAISNKCKLVRLEYGFSQEQMAIVIGISKKSLVETEKGRRRLSWTECVALCTIFSQSEVLQDAFGGELSDMIKAIAFEKTDANYPLTMGGKVWWRDVEEWNGYRIQQNMLSQHYRLLDPKNGRMLASFSLEEIQEFLKQIKNKIGGIR